MVYLGHVPWLIIPYQVGRWKGSGCAKRPSPFHVVSKKAGRVRTGKVDLLIMMRLGRLQRHVTKLSDHVHHRSPRRLGQPRKAASDLTFFRHSVSTTAESAIGPGWRKTKCGEHPFFFFLFVSPPPLYSLFPFFFLRPFKFSNDSPVAVSLFPFLS